MVRWRIYYSDGSTYSSVDGSWDNAPGKGVVAVVTLDPTGVWGRFVRIKHELYYKLDGHDEVLGSDSLGLIHVHVPEIRGSQIKMGGNVLTDVFQRIIQRATVDSDFPKGSPRRRASDWTR